MSRFVRSLKLLKDKALSSEKDVRMKCMKCGKRDATGQDDLCDHCRFDNILTRMVE